MRNNAPVIPPAAADIRGFGYGHSVRQNATLSQAAERLLLIDEVAPTERSAATARGEDRGRENKSMNEEFDFIVAGSGGGSMCAGLVLRNAGKSVLILEKMAQVGGSTARAGGVMWVPANRFMARDGVADSIEQATAYLDATCGTSLDAPGTSPERRATYLSEINPMIDFLVEEGIPFDRNRYWPDYYDERPGGVEAGRTVSAAMFDVNELGPWKDKLHDNNISIPARFDHLFKITLFKRSWLGRVLMFRTGLRIALAKVTGKKWVIGGTALQGRMLQAALAKGINIRLEAPVTELIIEDGVARGVVTQRDGKPWRIGARLGILLNTGGFAHNQEMRDRYIPNTRAEWSHAAPGDTGDMHRELMRIGAAMGQMDEMVGGQMTVPPGAGPKAIQQQLGKPHAFLVDQSGVRYMNEGGSYMLFCQNMLARHREVPAIPSWMIFDSQYLADYMLANTMPGTTKPRSWLDEGYMRKGATIEELARACGMPPETLRGTTDRFNGFARNGVDEDFGRGKRAYDRFLGDYTYRPCPALGPVDKGPFYAIPVVPGDVGTYGGAVTDCDARVLREDGSVILGLYATGTTTASVMGRVYPGAGSSIGPAFLWGYVAAKHALLNEAKPPASTLAESKQVRAH
jgi:3-oxosteroid 1-dehydrogenase